MVNNENKNFAYTTHRIGGTTYKVKVVFNDSGTETIKCTPCQVQSEFVGC